MGLFDSSSSDTTNITDQPTAIGDVAVVAQQGATITFGGDIGLTGSSATAFGQAVIGSIGDRLSASSIPAINAGFPGVGGANSGGFRGGGRGIGNFIRDPKQLIIVALIGVGLVFAFQRKN